MCKSTHRSIRVHWWLHLYCSHHNVKKNRIPAWFNIILFVLQIAKSCRRRLRTQGSLPQVGASLEYHVSRQDMKLFRTLLVLVLSFLIMWSPIFINIFLILARNFLDHLYISSTMFFWVVTFTLANSALNPILYSVCQFKNGWHKVCCGSAVVPLQKGLFGSGRRQGMHPQLPWWFQQKVISNWHKMYNTPPTLLVTLADHIFVSFWMLYSYAGCNPEVVHRD